MSNSVYRFEKELWIGCQEDNGDICLHPTRDVSEDYNFPTSFIYCDDDSQFWTINNIEDMKKLEILALNYTCINICNAFDNYYLYVKVDKVIEYLENKFKNCKNFKDIYDFIVRYKDIIIAINRRINK